MDSDAVTDAPLPAPRRSRAGRDLPAAVGVGLGLGGAAVAALFLVRAGWVVLTVLAIGVAVWELSTALAVRGARVPLGALLVGSTAMLVGAWVGGADTVLLMLCLTVLAVLVARPLGDGDGLVRDVTSAVFVALYVPFLASFSVLLLRPEDGAWRVLAFIVVTVCSDIGGYAVGVLAGRHPLAPTVSPKKSWEGFAGSLVSCVVGGSLVVVLALGGSWWAGALLGVAAVTTATLGDLGESLVKRDLGIKDMGTLLPGHGGLMDRLDSLLPTAPVVWLVLTLLVPVTAQ